MSSVASDQSDLALEKVALLQWVRYHLWKIGLDAKDIEQDLEDGFLLLMLVQILSKEQLDAFHSRSIKDQPITDGVSVDENQRTLQKWLACRGFHDQGIDEQEHPPSLGSFLERIPSILWFLVGLSLGKCFAEHETESVRYLRAREMFEEWKIPFAFDDFGLENKGSAVLVRTCIIFDKMNMIRNEGRDRQMAQWTPPPQRYMTPKPLDIQVFEECVVRVFLSSTFRDMQNERNAFFHHGAVELKKYAKSIGIELVFIDLRWGLTSEDSSEGWVVIRCLDSIGKCPYFVCSLGARYGWIPNQHNTELNKSERLEALLKTNLGATLNDIFVEWRSETNKKYPFLGGIPGLSVTEYEIQYAALIEKPACSRVFFYIRDEAYTIENATKEEDKVLFQAESEEARKRQNELKLAIEKKYGTVVYQGPKHYSDLVTMHLKHALNKDFSGRTVRNLEDQAQHQFKMHRLIGFGGRKQLLRTIIEKVSEQLDSGGKEITVLGAESGIGKSSLMAATIRELDNQKNSNLDVIYHFVGCTNLSNYVESISIRFWSLAYSTFTFKSSEIFKESDFQREGIQGLLKEIGKVETDKKIVFLIDAINQLCPSQNTPVPHLLTWLPKRTPKNTAIVVSTIDTHPSCKTALECGLEVIPVKKLTSEEIEESTSSFLVRYDKKLDAGQIDMILEQESKTGHPLYLRIVLDEIRVFGVYEQLYTELYELLSTTNVIELYTLVINRWKSKYNSQGSNIVDLSMKVLFISRIGLSEGDLDKYVENFAGQRFNLAEWKSFFFALVDSLFVRNGRYMYFHQLLLETTEKYFFFEKDSKKQAHKDYGMWLYGQYAEDTGVDQELVAEVCYQLLEGECYELLAQYIKAEHVAVSMLTGRHRYEFFTCWRVINSTGATNYKDAYSSLIKSLTKVGDLLVDFFLESFENIFLSSVIVQRIAKRQTEQSKFGDYLALGRVYKNLQNWSESMAYLQKCLQLKIESGLGDDESMADIYDEVGFLLQKEKKYEQALHEYRKSYDIRVRYHGKEDHLAASSNDNFGHIHLLQNKISDALLYYNNSLEIRLKKVGNEHPLVALSFENIGHVFKAEKRYEESVGYYEKAKTILEKSFGERHPSVASIISHIGHIHYLRGRLQESLAVMNQSLAIYIEGLGSNHVKVVETYDQVGDINHDLEEYRLALEAYATSLEIRKRTLGNDHIDVATSLENVGRTNFELQRNDQVIEYFKDAMKIRKETKTSMVLKDGAQYIRIAELMKERKEHALVLEFYKSAAIIFGETTSFENWNTWVSCEYASLYCKDQKIHAEAIEFWTGMKSVFEQKLGWTHPRTLNSCEYISLHSKEIGINKEPIEFTNVEDFIVKILDNAIIDSVWNYGQIVAQLLKIVYLSKEKPDASQYSSTAATLLNFMNVPLSGFDFAGISIPEANLSSSFVDGSDFTGSDLSGVNFTKSFIGNCKLNETNLKHITFGLAFEELKGHTDSISCVCAIDGTNEKRWLACGSYDKSITIRDLVDGSVVKSLVGHSDVINSVCFMQKDDILYLASASNDKSVRLWDLGTGRQLRVFEGHIDYIKCVCFVEGPSGQIWLASGGVDRTIRIWDYESSSQIKVLKGHTNTVTSICTLSRSYGNMWLASGSKDKSIRVWDLSSGDEVKRMKGHGQSIYCVCKVEGPKGEEWLVSSSKDKTIRVWDLKKECQVRQFEGHTKDVNYVCTVDGLHGEKWLASACNDKTVRLWDLVTGTQIRTLEGHADSVWCVAPVTGPNGEKWLASGSDDKTVRLWDFMGQRQLKILENVTFERPYYEFIKTPTGEQWFASETPDKSVAIWDIQLGREVTRLSVAHISAFSYCLVKAESGQMLLATGCSDKAIRIWDVGTGSQVNTLKGHTDSVTCLCSVTGPNGENWIASGSCDKTIRIWDLANGNEKKVLKGHIRLLVGVCRVSGPNGECWLASIGNDKTLRIWDIASGSQVHLLQRSEVTFTRDRHLVKKDKHEKLLASFYNAFDAINLTKSQIMLSGKITQVNGERKLECGDIQLQGAANLSESNKLLLSSVSRVSFS